MRGAGLVRRESIVQCGRGAHRVPETSRVRSASDLPEAATEELDLEVAWSNTWTSVHWSMLAWRENDWAHKRTRWEAPGKVDSVAVARVRDGCVCQRMHHNEHVRANENLSLSLVLLHLSRERENEPTVFAL